MVLESGGKIYKAKKDGIKQEELLYPALNKLFAKAGIKLKDINRFFYLKGPGRFTGIRIGITLASVLSEINGVKSCSADLFEALKYQAEKSAAYKKWLKKNMGGALVIILHAFREEYFSLICKEGEKPVWSSWEELETKLKNGGALFVCGWDRERIGSHIIRNNTIFDCGQNGIVGHMGCAFSEIYGNHIYNIGNLHEFFGYEIAGIKLHAAIDTYIHHNYIHDCRLGMWYDWQAQGTRISSNLLHDNERDIFIEVTHGPHIVDNNIFASEHNFCNAAQGGAYIHNLFAGSIKQYQVLERSTPYHLPHSTMVMGTAATYSYDDRIIGNIFGFTSESDDNRTTCGTHAYNGCPVSMDEYIALATKDGRGDIERFLPVKQCAYIDGNCYVSGAEGFDREEHNLKSDKNADIHIIKEDDSVYLDITLPEKFEEFKSPIIKSHELDVPRITEAPYEDADGKEIVFDTDYNGSLRTGTVGPLATLKGGHNRIKVWG